ncbi:histone deacetylase, partial [Coccomyxa subellipsoidea C-169]
CRGAVQNGAAIVRPPGHHAESGMAMGFCYFNNAGLAARAAQAAGARRVLVLDWDVHHGNGTQHIFEHDPGVMYMSIHRYDGGHFYPGTGAVKEVGRGAGEGFTVNVPWPMGGMGNGDYMAAFSHVIIPIAHEYSPDLIIVSAGFDASAGDPIGGCRVTPEAYAHMTAMLGAVAPLAVLLEGGYNLTATAAGCEAVLRVLLGAKPPRFAKP